MTDDIEATVTLDLDKFKYDDFKVLTPDKIDKVLNWASQKTNTTYPITVYLTGGKSCPLKMMIAAECRMYSNVEAFYFAAAGGGIIRIF